MLSLQPREQFTIVRQLGDHTDPTVYYVQATVRDSIDDSVLEVLNLVNTGSNRFKAIYEVPSDVSGLGFYIDINTSVYDDSGYTSKASTYSDENESYLVFDRITRPGGSGGGMDVDYKKIQKMLDALRKSMKDPKEFDTKPIMAAIMGVEEKVEAIIPAFPKPSELNLDPVIKQILTTEKTIITAIDEKEVTPETNLSPVLEAIEEKTTDFSGLEEKVAGLQNTIEGHIAQVGEKEASEEETSSEKLSQIHESIMPILSKTKPVKEKKPIVDKGEVLKTRAQSLL